MLLSLIYLLVCYLWMVGHRRHFLPYGDSCFVLAPIHREGGDCIDGRRLFGHDDKQVSTARIAGYWPRVRCARDDAAFFPRSLDSWLFGVDNLTRARQC